MNRRGFLAALPALVVGTTTYFDIGASYAKVLNFHPDVFRRGDIITFEGVYQLLPGTHLEMPGVLREFVVSEDVRATDLAGNLYPIMRPSFHVSDIRPVKLGQTIGGGS